MWAYWRPWYEPRGAEFTPYYLCPTDSVTGKSIPPCVTPQLTPKVQDCDYRNFQAMDADGCLVAMGDGSVRTVNPNISGITWFALIWRASGMVIGNDW